MAYNIMLDASVLIEHFRKKNKDSTFYTQIIRENDFRSISVVAKLEVLYGARADSIEYWDSVFATMIVVPFTDKMVAKAHEIVLGLKRRSLLVEIGDIMIAASAIVKDIPLATLNRKHFERIEGLILVDDEGSLP